MTTKELVAALVAIDSVNPDLVPGGAGEAAIAAFVADWLRGAGLEVEIDEPAPGRPSVVATTALKVCVPHKGFVWAGVETTGRAAHGSRPAEGVDAITRMAPVLSRLAELQGALDAGPRHELVGPGSVHA